MTDSTGPRTRTVADVMSSPAVTASPRESVAEAAGRMSEHRLGSVVVVLDTKRDEEITYNLVTSEEADAASGKVSTSSPIGRALLNKMVGDEVKVQSPGGVKELEILKLTTIHDV